MRAAAIQGRAADGEIDGDGFRLDDDDRRLLVDGWRRSVPLSAAANDAADMLRGELQPAKRGPLDRISLKTDLAVETYGIQLEEALHARRATILAIIGPPDDRGWVSVRALSVLTSNSPIRRDDDERR